MAGIIIIYVVGSSAPLDDSVSNRELGKDATSWVLPLHTQQERAAFVASLRACAKIKDIHTGTRVHHHILKSGLVDWCCNALVAMYASCGELDKARELLDTHKSTDVASWTALIAGYVRNDQAQNALDCFGCMQGEGISPNAVTYACVLKACGIRGALDKGEEIHDEIVKQGLLHESIVLGTALLDMYVKCGSLSKAQDVLEKLPSRDVICWSALIAGYAQEGQGEQALKSFESMEHEGICPNEVTYASLLKACASIGAAEKGKEIHDRIARQALLQNNVVLVTALVDMYAKCGALSKAQDVFDMLPSHDVVAWSALIAGYVQEGQGKQALKFFERMKDEGVLPDAATYTSVLKACASIGAIDQGKEIHDEIKKQGLIQDHIMVGNALVDMYAKCGALSKAQDVLENLPSRDVISWNALIAGYAQEGQGRQALICFELMQHEGIPPNAVTYICIVKACATIGAVDKGEEIHNEVVKQGLLQDNSLLHNALVDMYAKCGLLLNAQEVLEKFPSRDVVSWNALIAGYAQEGQGEQAVDCFERMKHEGVLPDAVTYASVLKACGAIGAADKGKQVHDEVAKQGLLQSNTVLGVALVDMYAKCGALKRAQDVLEDLPYRNVVSWNALIAGYSQKGQGKLALFWFERMQWEGILPNAVTFVCVLNVCSHLGLVEEGHTLFAEMRSKYGVKPNLECYTCMVDLLGRAGLLEKAVHLIQEMPSSDYYASWVALLGACQKWGDIGVGRWAFEQAVEVDNIDGPAYVLMANIYAATGMRTGIRALRKRNKLWVN